jgi:hypothetical protein
MSEDDDPDVEGMIRGVDEGMDELAATVAGDVEDLLDVRTEYVASEFEYDNRTHEKSVTVRVDIGLAEELRGRYDDVKLGDGGRVELRMTIDADRA